jgi:hypothetical protein
MNQACCWMVRLCLWAALGTSASGGWSEQLFDHTSYDFGHVGRGTVLQHTFRITNRFNQRVHIASVQPSCPVCSVAKPAQEWLEPGETTEIVATLRTLGFTGERTVSISVTFDYPSYDQTRLTLRCYSRPDVVVQPGALEYGPVRRNSTVVQTIRIDYAGRSDWKIVRAPSLRQRVSVLLRETYRDEGRVSYEVQAVFHAGAEIGPYRDFLRLELTDPFHRALEIPIHATVVGDASLSSERLYLGLAQPGQALSKVLIARGSNGPLRIESIETGPGPFRVEHDDQPRQTHLLKVVFEAPDKPGIHTQAFLIHVRTASGEPEVLPFSATATVTPAVP